jgi:light-regulated signal transduction histidine kinase (bacteriophytochrome)
MSRSEPRDRPEIAQPPTPSRTLLAVDTNNEIITYADPLVEQLLGASPATLVGKRISELRGSLARSPIEQNLVAFTSDAAHDLVGPLNQAASLVGLLVKKYGEKLDGDAQEILDHLQNAAKRMMTVGEGVRSYLRIVAQEQTLRSTDSRAALTSALFRIQNQIDESNVSVTGETLPELVADPAQLTTLFANLISNSIKFRKRSEAPRIHIRAVAFGAVLALFSPGQWNRNCSPTL